MFKKLLTIESCCQVLGKDMAKEFPEELMKLLSPDEVAYKQSKIITEAVNFLDNGNKPWIPDWNNGDEEKYQPIYIIDANEENPSGVGFSVLCYGCSATPTRVGARHIFKTSKGLYFAVKQFEDIYKALILISK